MKIRKVVTKDNQQLLGLLREFYFEYSPKEIVKGWLAVFDKWAAGIAEDKIIENGLTNPELITFVAEDGDELIGFITGKVKAYPKKELNKAGDIWDLFVADGHRQKGVGKQLIKALEDEFRQLGCTHLELWVFVTNEPAIAAYRKMGFVDDSLVMKRVIE